MCALFEDPALFEDDDLVGLKDGVEAVSDGECRTPFHELACGFFEQGLGLRVEAGSGFVEDQDGGVFEEGAGEGEALGLSAGEAGSVFADDGFVFFGQRFNEVMQACGFGCVDDLFIGCIRFAEANIFPRRYRGRGAGVEEPRRWNDEG